MKHAFLIMAYNNYKQLDLLIKSLDSEDCDIFLHIDSKSKNYEPPILKKSSIHMISRKHTNWGGIRL